MKHTKIKGIVAFFLAHALLASASAQAEPLPGIWDRGAAVFVFDEKTKDYVLFSLQSHDNDIVTECLSAAYFQKLSFHQPKFFVKEKDQSGRRCVVSNEVRSGSTTMWRQVCTDPNGSTEDERQLISISSDELSLEGDYVETSRRPNSSDWEIKNKTATKFWRIGECDEAPKAHALPLAQPTQSEQDASDRRYETRDDGTIRDTKTGLDWTHSDNGADVNWNEAARYCAGKGSGWRLGSPDELKGIYDTLQSTPCGRQTCRVSSKFRLSNSRFWSNELKHPSYAWNLYLYNGLQVASHVNDSARVLCVRPLP